MVKAMGLKVGSSTRKLVLLKLADNANDKGECWPSYQHIADHAEMGHSTVKTHIKALEKAGFLIIESRNDGKSSNKYILTLDAGTEQPRQIQTRSGADPVSSEPGQEETPTRSGADPVTRSGADPRTSHSSEPASESVNTTTNTPAKPDPLLTDRDEVTMADDWQPKPETIGRIEMQLGIPPEFCQSLIPEFRIFWLTEHRTPERNRTWDTAFLSQAKLQWEKSKTKLALMAKQPSWNLLDHDFSSWHALATGDFHIDRDHLQGWLTQCQLRRMAVSVKTIEHFAEHLREAERLTALPVSMLIEEVFANGWSRFEADWLINKFGLCQAEQDRIKTMSTAA